METQIKNLSKEEILTGIDNGTFLTDSEIAIVQQGKQLSDADNSAMTDAYLLLRDLSTNPEHGDPDETIDIDAVREAMHEYAYNNGLEFHHQSGQFWEPSSC